LPFLCSARDIKYISKVWLARKPYNVPGWIDMSSGTCWIRQVNVLCLVGVFFNGQSAYLWVQTVLLFSPTCSFIRMRQTSYGISVSENFLVESEWVFLQNKICLFLAQGIYIYVGHSFIWNTVGPTLLFCNILGMFGGRAFQQTVGIPMGTNCCPLLADKFLYS
jgi:hypothetical protein